MTHAHSQGRHGHHHDRGPRAALRYLRLLPQMWRSEVNGAVVRELAIRTGEQVVDLGAGAGAATVVAAESGARVLAVDPMPFMRSVLNVRKRLHPRGAAISIRDGAAESIPAPDASVDALWSVNTLHHWTDREAAARELTRVLKPGARVILLDEDFEDHSHPQHFHDRKRRRRAALVFDEVDPTTLAQTLKAAGFTQAEGSRTWFNQRPVKMVRATR